MADCLASALVCAWLPVDGETLVCSVQFVSCAMAVKDTKVACSTKEQQKQSSSSAATVTVNEQDSEDYAEMMRQKSEEYAQRIAKLQEDCLIPLKEDLADWINRVVGKS